MFFLIVLTAYAFFHFQNNLYNFLGEKLFLEFHQNQLAIKILEIPHRDDYYNHFLLGRIYFVENKLDKSIENYTKSIGLKPAFKESYYGRGLSYGFFGNIFLDEAENDFKKYTHIAEEEFLKTGRYGYGVWAGYNDLAWIHFLQGDFEKAEAVAKQGLKISSENPWLLNMLSVSLIEQGKCVEAYPIIQKAKNLADKMLTEEFGEAYTGDNKNWWSKGLEQMKKTINENLLICANVK